MRGKAAVILQGNEAFMRTPYLPEFVQGLKDRIPPSFRRWDPTTKVWVVHSIYWPEAISLLNKYFDVIVKGKFGSTYSSNPPPNQEGSGMPSNRIEAYKTLNLLPSAPDELVKAAYRVMAKICHPDVGGSTAKMREVNQAYEILS